MSTADVTSLRSCIELLANSVSALVAYIDADLRYGYVNPLYLRYVGQPCERVLGRRVEEVLGPTNYRVVAPHLQQALRGEPVRFQARITFATHGERDVDVQCRPVVREDGTPLGIAVLVLDATAEARLAQAERERQQEERRATERLQRLLQVAGRLARAVHTEAIAEVVVDEGVEALDAALGGLWVMAPDGQELVLVRQRGFSPENAAAFARLSVLRAGPLATCVNTARPEWCESRAQYAARYPAFESTHRPADPPPLAFGALPVVVEERVVGCMCFAFHDERRLTPNDRTFLEALCAHASEALHRAITAQENARLYEAAEQARREAEAANRAKDQFLAMLGHELRNPLSPITTALHLMKMRAPTQLTRERTVLERQVAHLTRLVDDLLDISRITRGKVELRREEVSIAVIVRRAIEMASPLLEQRQHRLHVDVERGLAVLGDGVRLAQVVANLLTNAAKYTNPGGQVVLRAFARGDQVVLSVRDDGIGLDPQLLPSVFEMFVQAPQTSARTEGGLGLGLAIVRSLVQLHGGSVSAHSDGPGTGTEFSVCLPALPVFACEDTGVVVQPPPASETPARVLVVDDNQDAALLLADVLTMHGHQVCTALDGPSALRIAARLRPTVAILDIGLPVMDGYELAQRLRADPVHAGLYMIAVTGYGQDTDRARSMQVGFAHHLAKPVSTEQLLRLVNRFTETVRQGEEVAAEDTP